MRAPISPGVRSQRSSRGITSSPDPGYPAGETEPAEGGAPSPEHPEDIGSTPSDDQGAEDVTETPGTQPDPSGDDVE